MSDAAYAPDGDDDFTLDGDDAADDFVFDGSAAAEPAPEPDNEDDGGSDGQGWDGAPDADAERRARAQGWRPLAEFRGDPTTWVDAKTYLARAEEELPIMRDQLRRMTDKVSRLEGAAERQRAELARLQQVAERADEAGYRRAMDELKQRQREAVAQGDTDAFEQIDEQIEALQQARTAERAPPPPPPPQAEPEAPAMDPALTQFMTANAAWWRVDTGLSEQMIAHHTIVLQKHPDMPLAQQLAEAKRRLIADNPESPYFANEAPVPQPPRQRPAAAAPRPSTTRAPSPSQGQLTGWNTIADPVEREQAKRMYQKQKQDDPGLTASEFLTLFHNPRADALALRAKRKK